MMKKWQIVLCCVFVAMIMTSMSAAQDRSGTITERIAARDDLTILQQLLDAADPEIRAWLDNPDNSFTFFAPTDHAWQLYLDEVGITLEELLQRTDWVNDTLRYHIVPMALLPRQTFEQTFIPCHELGTMLPDSRLVFDWEFQTQTFRFIYDPQTVGAPLAAANGLVYIVDHVVNEVTLLGVSGDHTPEGVPTSTPEPKPPRLPIEADSDVQTTLENDGRFTILLRLLSEYPLYENMLNSDGLYMLFAPTDTAFEQFFAENVIPTSVAFEQNFGALFLSYNILPGYFTPDRFFEVYTGTDGSYCSFRRGEAVEIIHDNEHVLIGDVPLTGETLIFRNGVIFVTEGVHLNTPFRG
jgi:uncharacterized surface protein with fasciclin (FAS1) repeats